MDCFTGIFGAIAGSFVGVYRSAELMPFYDQAIAKAQELGAKIKEAAS